MKKLIAWTSLILAVSLFAEPGDDKGQLKRSMKVVPLSSIYLSTENGGSNHAAIVLADGVGVYITQDDEYARAISYLDGKYGDDALKDDKSLKDYVLDNGTVADKELAEKLGNGKAGSVIGDPCDDENAGITGGTYVDENFTCEGVLTRNESKCFGDEIGSEFLVNGVYHLVVDNTTIRDHLNRAETLCTSNVTDMSELFKNKSTFNELIGNWDTSRVTNMYSMFDNATSFNQPLNWDTGSVTSMSLMFAGATSFNQLLNWDTSQVANMHYMFYNATSFNQLLNWNTSNVKNMYFMFYYASSFNQDISAWQTGNVTNMYAMFQNASSFNQPIGNWDTSNVTDMRNMFKDATLFNQDLSNWCMINITKKPNYFDSNTHNWNKTNRQPIWGTCP